MPLSVDPQAEIYPTEKPDRRLAPNIQGRGASRRGPHQRYQADIPISVFDLAEEHTPLRCVSEDLSSSGVLLNWPEGEKLPTNGDKFILRFTMAKYFQAAFTKEGPAFNSALENIYGLSRMQVNPDLNSEQLLQRLKKWRFDRKSFTMCYIVNSQWYAAQPLLMSTADDIRPSAWKNLLAALGALKNGTPQQVEATAKSLTAAAGAPATMLVTLPVNASGKTNVELNAAYYGTLLLEYMSELSRQDYTQQLSDLLHTDLLRTVAPSQAASVLSASALTQLLHGDTKLSALMARRVRHRLSQFQWHIRPFLRSRAHRNPGKHRKRNICRSVCSEHSGAGSRPRKP